MSGSIAVEVAFTDGQSSAGTTVTASSGVLTRTRITEAFGAGASSAALFMDLPAGDYLVTLASLDHELVEPPPPVIARVQDGVTTQVVVAMGPTPAGPPETGAILGVVVATNGAPIECATVTLGALSGLTTRLGQFAYADIPAGDHQLVASAPGFEPVILEVRLLGGQTVELRPVLEPAVAPAGVVTAEVAPATAAPSLVPLVALAISATSLALVATR
jgi:hypothetical protein